MTRNILYNFFKIFFIYISFFLPKRLKINKIEGFNFRRVDFTNYKKIKVLIFKNNFIDYNNETSINNFDFLNYTLKIGGKNGIEIAKKNIFLWQKKNKFKNNNLWASEVVASRILNLIYNYEFINSLSSRKDEKKLLNIIALNIIRFNFEIFFKKDHELSIQELKVKLLISLISSRKLFNYESKFINIIEDQLDSFALHRSYNLLDHSKFINDITEIIDILLRFNLDIPEIFLVTKIKMATTLSQYFHKDGSVALFNGSHNLHLNAMKTVLKQDSFLKKIIYPNDKNGIFFYEDKIKKIFFDVVQPTKSNLSKKLSAGTLSIEFSSNKEKIITNCGTLEKLGGNAAYLRYSAAHSTIVLKNTNISEIRENQPHLKFPQLVDFKQNKSNDWITCEGSHNGYIKNYKKIIKRKISFRTTEESIFGEDHIISSVSKNQEVVFHIRFHIMPNINILETNKKRSVILKTEKNSIWTFKASIDLVLEESLFVDNNDTSKTNQIVIKGITKNNREILKWSLVKT